MTINEMIAKRIYRDCLGKLCPQATISVFGGKYGKPNTGGHFSLNTMGDCPSKNKRWDYTSYDVSHIIAEMEAEGWVCTVSRDGYNAPRIDCIHTATQVASDISHKLSNDKFANAERGYIRFGKCPKSGKSTNHRDGVQEAGVSVFNADFCGKDYRVWVTDYQQVTYVSVIDRPAYRIYGEEVGTGADGEPVLKVSKIVKL